MSPTTDDLRALLEQRAAEPPEGLVDDGARGARLAGVRHRIRQRRRARAAAAALSIAILVGSAAATAQWRGRPAAVEPAELAPVDGAGRPLAAKITGEGLGVHWQTAHLDKGWADLHLVAHCTGGDGITATALLDGRVVAQSPCADGRADVTVTRDQAAGWGLAPDSTIATVGLHLSRTPAAGAAAVLDQWAVLPPAHGELGVYTTAHLQPLPEYRSIGGAPVAAGQDVHLAGLSLPITKDFGTRSFTFVTSSPNPLAGLRCTVPDGAPPLGVVVTAGRTLVGVLCLGARANSDTGFGPGDDARAWESIGFTPGRPFTVAVRVVRTPQGALDAGPSADIGALPDLREDVPGASVALALQGAPYVPGTPPTPGRLDPPAARDGEGRPLAVNLVAQPGRPASVSFRLRTGSLDLVRGCAGAIPVAAQSDNGWGFPPQACQGSAAGLAPAEPPGTVRTVRLSTGGGDPSAGVGQVAVYGDVEVISVVQPAVASLGDGSLPALSSGPGPDVAVDDADATPRTGEITVAAGHSVTVSVAAGAGWGFQTVCTSTRLSGTLTVDGVVRALDCTPHGEVRATVNTSARRLTVGVAPGAGFVRLALHGATISEP